MRAARLVGASFDDWGVVIQMVRAMWRERGESRSRVRWG